MKTQITIRCPSCLGLSIKKNGWKIYGKQNYQCKGCHRQFIHEMDLSYQGRKSEINAKICLMLVRGCSVADVDIEGNNNRFRQRLRRVFRKTCCFSKKLENHFKAFDLLFHYVNYGWV